MLAKLRSRKFLMALAAAIYVVLTQGLGLNVPEHVYNYVVDLVITYIAVEGAVDLGRVIAPVFTGRKQEAA